MRTIAIVGAGQTGLLAAHGLVQAGYDVTLYSDKTPEQFLDSKPVGNPCRFSSSLDFERQLGIEHWSGVAPRIDGIHLTVSPRRDNRLLTLLGRFSRHALAVDARLQSAVWLRELEARGGAVHVEKVTLGALEQIAAAHELTLIAGGRSELMELFPRDPRRSVHAHPARRLAMVSITGVPMQLPCAPWLTPVKFNLFAPYGEAFFLPWLSKDMRPSWSLLFEAKESGPFDRFRSCRSGAEVLAIAKALIAEFVPWDYAWLRDGELCDENAWLVGGFTPYVRQVVGTLPSGRCVMALGDTAHALDPIGGQGANNGNRMTRVLLDAVVAHADRPFDEAFMRATFERFWARHGAAEAFNNMLLEPLGTPAKMIMLSQYGSSGKPDDHSAQQRLANAFVDNFDDPSTLTGVLQSGGKARALLRETFGSGWSPLVSGATRVALGQVRQRRGQSAGHPGT